MNINHNCSSHSLFSRNCSQFTALRQQIRQQPLSSPGSWFVCPLWSDGCRQSALMWYHHTPGFCCGFCFVLLKGFLLPQVNGALARTQELPRSTAVWPSWLVARLQFFQLFLLVFLLSLLPFSFVIPEIIIYLCVYGVTRQASHGGRSCLGLN